ncbi:uncharacterized protein LOC109809597 [Cajanus cajan]|uniref:Protein HAPLESS 2 n=1 Tax=Cajanus cajan TaxID=3821 RepID=A0A151SJV6_CAJCA|nr:uncharacterized protein LOC109809597 [Cajanus cajan]KYP55134.1 hypothetical protein KK1_001339 [Cajanus cajan]
MGNVLESFASGLGNAVGKLFNSPIEFLSGKSCSSACGPTWDLMCYIEHFCVANLLKLAMVFMLLYIVLLFLYLVHKLGICGCLCRSSCKMIWACFSSCFHVWEYSCTFLCVKLHQLRRRRRRFKRGMNQKFYLKSGEDYTDESLSYHYFPTSIRPSRSISRRRDYKGSHLKRSLQPRQHLARVEISRDLRYKNKRNHISGDSNSTSTVHDIKVIRTSKFARKGINKRKRVLPRHRR